MVWMDVYTVVFISLSVALNQVHLLPLIKEVRLILAHYNHATMSPPPLPLLSLQPPFQNVPRTLFIIQDTIDSLQSICAYSK